MKTLKTNIYLNFVVTVKKIDKKEERDKKNEKSF